MEKLYVLKKKIVQKVIIVSILIILQNKSIIQKITKKNTAKILLKRNNVNLEVFVHWHIQILNFSSNPFIKWKLMKTFCYFILNRNFVLLVKSIMIDLHAFMLITGKIIKEHISMIKQQLFALFGTLKKKLLIITKDVLMGLNARIVMDGKNSSTM